MFINEVALFFDNPFNIVTFYYYGPIVTKSLTPTIPCDRDVIYRRTQIKYFCLLLFLQVIKMLFVVVLLFCLCWLPWHLYHCLVLISPGINQWVSTMFLSRIVQCNSTKYFFSSHLWLQSLACHQILIKYTNRWYLNPYKSNCLFTK